MIILYSITGIITVLFLAIIITGAVRAHRHPERYGPRYAAGRSRQSRARGIARAMLETIPIVKFGDEPEGKPDPAKGDVEMGMGPESGTETPTDEQRKETTPARDTVQPASPDEVPSNDEKRTSATPSATPDTGNFSCPICTDDFVKGQDLRVLPCNHKFHPECIDPWLVNVSGTCPLWYVFLLLTNEEYLINDCSRIDLNPPQEEQEEEQGTDSHPQTRDQTPERAQTRQRRLTGYFSSTLNARRMREATVEERLAALRTVREEANRSGGDAEDADEQRWRNRLSTRLRERFRIRTRPHEGDQSDTPQS